MLVCGRLEDDEAARTEEAGGEDESAVWDFEEAAGSRAPDGARECPVRGAVETASEMGAFEGGDVNAGIVKARLKAWNTLVRVTPAPGHGPCLTELPPVMRIEFLLFREGMGETGVGVGALIPAPPAIGLSIDEGGSSLR